MAFPYFAKRFRMRKIAPDGLTARDRPVPAPGAIMDSPKTPAAPKQDDAQGSCPPACPVCGGRLVERRGKLICSRCRTICETCCEGGRG